MKVAIEKPLLKSLALMASMIEARDAYTGGHLWRVSQFCGRLAESAGLPADMVFLSRLGGFLHDIGKVSIPDHILGKRGALSAPEYAIVKTHPGIGAELVQEHPLGLLALPAIHQHHEWVDGQGYPNRLQGEQISLFARIVAIADAFDALTSVRPYRGAVAETAAVQALQVEHGTQFDVRLLNAFVQLAQSDASREIIGHSQPGLPLAACPCCGPVIVIPRSMRDGDICCCRVCGSKHRLHREGDRFVVEPSGQKGSAEELRPRPEISAIDALVDQAPAWVEI